MRIVVLTEAGKNIGMGHFVRMSAVCDGLMEKGMDVHMLLNSDDVVRNMTQRNYVRHMDWLSGELAISEIAEDDVVIVDSYLVNLEKLNSIRSKCQKLIMIDDNIRLDYTNVSIVNPNIFGMFLNYLDDMGNDIHTGPECTLLRKEFNNEKDKIINKDVSDILITMGGTDVKNVTTTVVEYIRSINDTAKLHVVVTDAYDEKDKIKAAMGKDDILYENIDASTMSSLMRLADFTVASAGGTTNELIKMLCPSVLIGVADNQLLNLKYLSENNYIRRFDVSDMSPVRDMFDYEKRLGLYQVMFANHSVKTGIDVIAEIVRK